MDNAKDNPRLERCGECENCHLVQGAAKKLKAMIAKGGLFTNNGVEFSKQWKEMAEIAVARPCENISEITPGAEDKRKIRSERCNRCENCRLVNKAREELESAAMRDEFVTQEDFRKSLRELVEFSKSRPCEKA